MVFLSLFFSLYLALSLQNLLYCRQEMLYTILINDPGFQSFWLKIV